MAIGNYEFPVMKPINGIFLGTANAGIKQTERDDILLIQMDKGGGCAAVFTQNAFCAAPVLVAREHLLKNPRWLLINSGNANAGTGQQGVHDALTCCTELAKMVAGQTQQVLPFSTGIIGENLPIEKMLTAFPTAVSHLATTHWKQAAMAIMTTDTLPKGTSTVIDIEGHPVTINGICKGAGMIQPNMATMLSFVATDANISRSLLQQCLSVAVEQSFNRITVDGDTSTNDACVLLASGRCKAPEIKADSEQYTVFANAVLGVCKQLAEAVVRDGEGATKLIRIKVEQAESDEEALQVAKTVAHSPLVKTAFFAEDPNWGRILASVGRANVKNLILEKVKIYLGEVCIVENGGRAPDYTEAAGQKVMHQEEITVRVVLTRGQAEQEVLTCDLSYEYVRINAEYRS